MVLLAAVGAMGVAGVGAWVATPLVSMVRRGTRDEQTLAGWRDEAERAAAVQRAHRRAAVVASIPTQRRDSSAADQVAPQRRSPLPG